MPSAQTFITQALKDLGVLASGEVPTSAEADDCLEALNQWRDGLGLDKGAMYEVVRTTKTLAASTASYTIGTGGSINITRPTWIDKAGLVLDTGATIPVEVPIAVLSPTEYAEWPAKTQTGVTRAIWYPHGFAAGLGLVYPLPIPAGGTTQLVLYTQGVPVASFADLTTVYTFPPGYDVFIRKHLALLVAPMFSAPVSATLRQQAIDASAAILHSNVRPTRRQSSPGLGSVR